MDFKTKRRTRRMARVLLLISFAWIPIGIVGFFLSAKVSHNFLFSLPVIILLWGFTVIFYGKYDKELIIYKSKIRHYRQMVAYKKIIQFIRERDFKSAVYWYNNFIHDTEYRTFLFPFYVNELLHSTPSDCERGEEILAKQMEIFNPDKIFGHE
jgi:hypothetical protein